MTELVILAAFLWVEGRASNPILPFTLFSNQSRVAALCAIVLAGAIVMCLAVFISLYLQGVLGYSSLQSGLAVVPFAFGLGIAAARQKLLDSVPGARIRGDQLRSCIREASILPSSHCSPARCCWSWLQR